MGFWHEQDQFVWYVFFERGQDMRRVFLPLRLGIYLATFCFLGLSNSSASFCCLFCFRETLLLSCLFLFLRCPWGTEAMTAVWTLLPPAKNKKRAFFVLLFLFIILWSVSSCIRSACWLLHRSFLGVDDVPCFRFSCVWVCSFFFAGKANKFWNRNPEQDFSTPSRDFSAGDVQ